MIIKFKYRTHLKDYNVRILVLINKKCLAWFLSFTTVMSTILYKIYKTNCIITVGWNPHILPVSTHYIKKT